MRQIENAAVARQPVAKQVGRMAACFFLGVSRAVPRQPHQFLGVGVQACLRVARQRVAFIPPYAALSSGETTCSAPAQSTTANDERVG